jgi:two-component system alkaline phosphatase synthesis response regulator PhoP
MIRALLITKEKATRSGLVGELAPYDITCSFVHYNNGVGETIASTRPDIILLDIDPKTTEQELKAFIRRLRRERSLPILAFLPKELMETIDPHLDVEDYIISPFDPPELNLRIRRILGQSDSGEPGDEIIQRDGLSINLTSCEVRVEGTIMELTFKEYELLKLLAATPGRVYTREALLDKIWGYDYFGGDRTVDVHIRRLRSKIEETGHTFIETVRNIGYRFRAEPE